MADHNKSQEMKLSSDGYVIPEEKNTRLDLQGQ